MISACPGQSVDTLGSSDKKNWLNLRYDIEDSAQDCASILSIPAALGQLVQLLEAKMLELQQSNGRVWQPVDAVLFVYVS